MKLSLTLISATLIAGLSACGADTVPSTEVPNSTAPNNQARLAMFIDGYAEAKLNADFQVQINSYKETDAGFWVEGVLSPGIRAEAPREFSMTLAEQMGSLTVVNSDF